MVGIKKTIEVRKCDNCGAEDACYHCDCCGADYCFECGFENNMIIKYPHEVHFERSNDLELCVKCNSSPPPKIIPVLKAFQAIINLRKVEDAWHEDFKNKSKKAASKAAEELTKLRKK
jgi:hypothetical protein